MSIIKKLLFKSLGIKGYLRWVSKTFFWMYYRGRLKNKEEYQAHYYLPQLVRPGFICIDIGANLGYYSVLLSKLVKEKGKIYAVEPVPVFQEILKKNLASSPYNNVELLPYALGDQDGGTVKMGMTVENGVFRHGLTKVIDSNEDNQYFATKEVKVHTPASLFSKLSRIDYIKCDVEGYERVIIPLMKDILLSQQPIVQLEIGSQENKEQLFPFFESIGYSRFYLENQQLKPHSTQEYHFDYYFVPTKQKN